MSLHGLPDEILSLILGYLEDEKKTLANVSLCCKRLHRLSVVWLYSHVSLVSKTQDPSLTLRCFTDSVLSNESLARLVRSIDLNEIGWFWFTGTCDWSIEEDEFFRDGRNVDTQTLLNAVSRVTGASETHRRRWSDALREDPRNYDAMVALLLASLPALRRLDTPWASDLVYTLHVFDKMALDGVASSVLKKLTHLMLSCEDDGVLYTFPNIISLLQIPSLTHVFGAYWGANFSGDRHDIQSDGPALSITHLELRHCHLKSHELEHLLARCKSLQTFILHREGRHCGCDTYLPSHFLGEILKRVRRSLRRLRLSQELCYGFYDELTTPTLPIDFSIFPSLTHLHVAAGHLVREPGAPPPLHHLPVEARILPTELWERLPASLEVLRIMGPSSSAQLVLILDAVAEVIRRRELFPCLGEIRIEARFAQIADTYDITGLLREAQRQGIVLRRMESTPAGPPGCIPVPEPGNWGMNEEYEWSRYVMKECVRALPDLETDVVGDKMGTGEVV